MAKWLKHINPDNPYQVEWAKKEEEWENKRRQELIDKGYTPLWDENNNSTHPDKDRGLYGDCDHPNTPENSTVTIFWIVGMVITLLFKGGWVLCILETVAWWKFITRHNKK